MIRDTPPVPTQRPSRSRSARHDAPHLSPRVACWRNLPGSESSRTTLCTCPDRHCVRDSATISRVGYGPQTSAPWPRRPLRSPWSALLGLPVQTWTLYVQASGTQLQRVALRSQYLPVTVTCTGASASGIGGSGTCAGLFTLSTSPQLVASGAEGAALGTIPLTSPTP